MMNEATSTPFMPPAVGRQNLVFRYVVGASIAALVLATPFLASSYLLFQLTMVLVYAIALLGLNILTGYNGQISIGHGAFYAVGAYVAAILMDQWTVPYWLTLPAAGLVCLVIGFFFGLPALRLAGLYLALATYALGVALPQLLKFKGFERWTGGMHGIILNKPDAPFGLPVNADQWIYYFTLAAAVVMFVLGWNLLRGRVGRALMAVRDHPVAAASMGVNTPLYKSLAFGVSAMFTGIAGALGAIAVQFVSPESFTIFLSISFLVGIVVGGVATISGAIFGAVFIQFIPNFASAISEGAPWAIYGVVLIAMTCLAPRGIAGIFFRSRNRRKSGGKSQG